MTMRTPPQRQSPRSGPLAPSVDLQCLCGACNCLRQLRTYKSSQVLYYLPSRRNRRCTAAHGDQVYIRNILHWCVEAAKRFSILVAIFLSIRVVIDLVCSHLVSRAPCKVSSFRCFTSVNCSLLYLRQKRQSVFPLCFYPCLPPAICGQFPTSRPKPPKKLPQSCNLSQTISCTRVLQ